MYIPATLPNNLPLILHRLKFAFLSKKKAETKNSSGGEAEQTKTNEKLGNRAFFGGAICTICNIRNPTAKS